MKHVLFLATVLIAAAPLSAQQLEISARAVWLDITTDTEFENIEDDFATEFDSETGFGLGLNYYLNDAWSVELTASIAEPDLTLTLFDVGGPAFTDGLEIVPITLGLQYHWSAGTGFDFYLGGGAAFVTFDDFDDEDLEPLRDRDVGAIEIDDASGWMANAGISYWFWRNLGVNLDAKYLSLEPDFAVTFDRGDFTDERAIDFDPLMISAGVSWRF